MEKKAKIGDREKQHRRKVGKKTPNNEGVMEKRIGQFPTFSYLCNKQFINTCTFFNWEGKIRNRDVVNGKNIPLVTPLGIDTVRAVSSGWGSSACTQLMWRWESEMWQTEKTVVAITNPIMQQIYLLGAEPATLETHPSQCSHSFNLSQHHLKALEPLLGL